MVLLVFSENDADVVWMAQLKEDTVSLKLQAETYRNSQKRICSFSK